MARPLITEPNWRDIRYLSQGTPRQQHAYHAIQSLGILDTLADYHPILVGTIPLNIDIPTSDLDIICQADDIEAFGDLIQRHYGDYRDFGVRFKHHNNLPSYIANFRHDDFEFEVFAQHRPTTRQSAYRHMVIEYRLLTLAGEDAKSAIRKLKQEGMKTEPAFAHYFGLSGDPYQALLDLAEADEGTLESLVLHRPHR